MARAWTRMATWAMPLKGGAWFSDWACAELARREVRRATSRVRAWILLTRGAGCKFIRCSFDSWVVLDGCCSIGLSLMGLGHAKFLWNIFCVACRSVVFAGVSVGLSSTLGRV